MRAPVLPRTEYRVVGVDPGLANLGLGAVSEVGREATHVASVLLRTDSRTPVAERIRALHDGVLGFLVEHEPDALAIEGQYFHQQKGTAFKVGQAVGVVLLAASMRDVPVFEYGPMEVKQALVGSGRADKAQVAYMVRGMLTLGPGHLNHHAADALALALTHLGARRVRQAADRGSRR